MNEFGQSSPQNEYNTFFSHKNLRVGGPVMRHLVTQYNIQDEWLIDSAGTGYVAIFPEICKSLHPGITNVISRRAYHIGESPDPRSIRECQKMLNDKMPAVDHKARQVSSKTTHGESRSPQKSISQLRFARRIFESLTTSFVWTKWIWKISRFVTLCPPSILP